jgi:hypothetical protein
MFQITVTVAVTVTAIAIVTQLLSFCNTMTITLHQPDWR